MTIGTFASATPSTWIFYCTSDFTGLIPSSRLTLRIIFTMKFSLPHPLPVIFQFSLFLFHLVSVVITEDELSIHFLLLFNCLTHVIWYFSQISQAV